MKLTEDDSVERLFSENPDLRLELIAYYKWVVSLALFVLTVSLSIAGVFEGRLEFEWLFVCGWLLLGICVFSNWILVKRLTTHPIVVMRSREGQNLATALFAVGEGQAKIFGCIQNLTFLAGTLTVFAASLFNVFVSR